MKEGHRERLRQRYLRVGLDGLSDAEVLELILFYAIARRDVKPIAYALLERFGTLDKVFSADIGELQSVEGIGENSSILLNLFLNVNRRTRIQATGVRPFLTTTELAGEYAYELLINRKTEAFYAMLLDSQHRLIHAQLISEGTPEETPIYPRDIVSAAIRHSASNIVLAHNHPGGTLFPSPSDVEVTIEITKALTPIGIHCLDHIIVTEEGFYAMMAEKNFLRAEEGETGGAKFSMGTQIGRHRTQQIPLGQGDLERLAEIIHELDAEQLEVVSDFLHVMGEDLDIDEEI